MPEREQLQEMLEQAAMLIERGWTKGALARAAGGSEVPPESSEAACWCASGAIRRVGGREYFFELCRALSKATTYNVIPLWNDSQDNSAVVAVALRKAKAYV
jgi:hypothetical protein